MTPNWNNIETGVDASLQRQRKVGSSFALVLKLIAIGSLPLLTSCNQASVDSNERDALLRKLVDVNRSYVSFFRGERTDDLYRRRMKTVIALIRKIGDNKATGITERLMDLAFEDTMGEAQRIFKPYQSERCELVHLAGTYYARHSQLPRAEQFFRRHIEELLAGHKESNLKDMTLDPRIADAVVEDLQLLAPVLDSQGKSAEAAEARENALWLRKRNERKPVSVNDHIQLANSYAANKQFESARFEFKNVLASNPDSVMKYCANLGLARLESSAHNYGAAVALYQITLSQLAALPQAAGDYPSVELEFARVNRLAEKFSEAIDCYKKVIAYFETKKIPHNDLYNASLEELAEIYFVQKKVDVALPLVEKCVADAQRNPRIAKDFAVAALRMAGDVTALQGKDALAKSYYSRSVDIARSSNNNNLRFLTFNYFGQFLERRDIKLALKFYKEAIVELEKSGSLDDPGRRGPYTRTAVVEMITGHYDRAHALLNKAHQCAVKYSTTFNATDTEHGTAEVLAANAMMRLILSRIAENYCYQGKFKTAERYFRQASEVGPGPKDSQDRVHLNEFWAFKNWMTGDAAREKELFAEATRERKEKKVNERERLFLSLKKLADIYGKPNHPPVEVSLNGANQALDQMRAELGANNLYYVTMIKHLSEQFDSIGYKKESEALRRRADQEKVAALKNTPAEP